MVSRRTAMREDGTVEHIVTPESDEGIFRHDQYVFLTNINGNSDMFAVYGYDDEERVFSTTLQRRQLSFAPLTEIGRGETDTLSGVSETAGGSSIQSREDIQVLLNGFGFSIVPDGEWWLYE